MPIPDAPAPGPNAPPGGRRRLLVTAGPTHEPIDAVRYIANRSSGRLGIALADTAARRGDQVTLLLGPTPRTPDDPRVKVRRFQTTADLETLLAEHFPTCDTLIMAAAVADYRPRIAKDDQSPSTSPERQRAGSELLTSPDPSLTLGARETALTKLRRTESALTLELEPTPDLLASIANTKRPDQHVIGFALEPQDRLIVSAKNKLERKHLDAIVANPLETMDATTIRATVLFQDGRSVETPGEIDKSVFAGWLLDALRQ